MGPFSMILAPLECSRRHLSFETAEKREKYTGTINLSLEQLFKKVPNMVKRIQTNNKLLDEGRQRKNNVDMQADGWAERHRYFNYR